MKIYDSLHDLETKIDECEKRFESQLNKEGFNISLESLIFIDTKL